jgi:hypothetical protein
LQLLDESGSPVSTFNQGQPVTQNFQILGADGLRDGRLLIAGRSVGDGSPAGTKPQALELRMLNADGSPDLGWGTGGRLQFADFPAPLLDPPGSKSFPVNPLWAELNVLPNGSVNVLVDTYDGDGDVEMGWSTRLTPSGAVDTKYGTKGFVDLDYFSGDAEGTYSVDEVIPQLLSDGRIGLIQSSLVFEPGGAQNIGGNILSADGKDLAEKRPDYFFAEPFYSLSSTYTGGARRLMTCGTRSGRAYVVALKVPR